ncbi:hypothetical protein HD806DRAFT_452532 [Xylariaceae sp. AK1471]|nr:hypothetical protein HD806DRAFT_452532 [Xylariaceae sp. AK1471]
MATDYLDGVISDVSYWLKRLEEFHSQLEQRQQDPTPFSEAQPQSSARSIPNQCSTESITSTDKTTVEYKNKKMVSVYYDSFIQSFFEELVKFTSAQWNLLRKTRMASKVARIRQIAELEMLEDEEDDDISKLKLADLSALDKKQDGSEEVQLQYVGPRPLGGGSKNPALDYIPTRAQPTSALAGLRGSFNEEGDIWDELDKGLEYVQGMCGYAASRFLRDGDCNEEVEKIKVRLVQVKELVVSEKKHISVAQKKGEIKFELKRDAEPRPEHQQTRAIEKVLGREHPSTLTSLRRLSTRRDSPLKPEKEEEEQSIDDLSRSAVGLTQYTTTSKDSVAQDEGYEASAGGVSPSTGSAGSLSEISVGSKFNATEVDKDIDAFNPEHEETEIEYSGRVERFADPETWLARLERMRNEVIAASFFYRKISPLLAEIGESHSGGPPRITVLGNNLKKATEAGKPLTWEGEDVTEIISGVSTNLKTMQGAGYCAGSINFLALESNRPRVARLIHVAVDDINSLADRLKVAFNHKDSLAIKEACSEFLALLEFTTDGSGIFHIDMAVNSMDELSRHNYIELARFTALLLDLAILSYSGAHVEKLHDYLPLDKGLRFLTIPDFSLTRRTFNCLGAYLKRPVWVFEISNVRGIQDRSTTLYLSTRIADFASVWGPVWAITEPDKPDMVIRYNVGVGSIVGSKRDSDEPEPLSGEVFCHWISASDNPPPGLYINGELNGGRMLIGGKLNLNTSCTLDCDKFTLGMENNNRLLPLPVRWRKWYTDSRTISASLSGLGFTLGGSESYKLRHRPYREDLVDALSHEDFDCCLVAIQHRFVVEVSACTGLSRRQSLRYALGYSGMRDYMSASDLNWENDEWKETYFQIVREGDMTELRRRLNESGFGSVMKKALKKSMLNVLLKTGLEASKELIAFWMPSREDDPQVVSYPFRDYNWVGLLQEGSLGFNTAIVNDICLELPSKSRSRSLTCTHVDKKPNHYSLLETYLLVNDELRSRNELPKGLALVDCEAGKYRKRWSVHKIEIGEKFDLGECGSLKVMKVLMPSSRKAESGLVMDWTDLTSSRARDIYQVARQAIGITPMPLCHREYLIQRRGVHTAPILIHVVSHPYLALGESRS